MVKPGAFTPSWNKSTINFSIGPSKKTVATCSKQATILEAAAPAEVAAETTPPLTWPITAPTPGAADRYELKTNEDINDWSDLISLIDFINNTDLDAFGAGIDFRMDVDGFLRSAALDMLFSNLDSYTGSARNYYIYLQTKIQPLEWIKWDGNEAFGSYTNGAGNMETLAIDYANPTRPCRADV